MKLFDDDFKQEMLKLIRFGTEDVRQDISELKNMVGAQGMQLHSLQADVSYLKNTVRQNSSDIHKLDVLLEDLNDRFAAARELRWD